MRFHSVASPLIALRFRFGSRRSDSVSFRCRSQRRLSIRFLFGAVRVWAFPLLIVS
nr:MAG TPA: hypothetical protein [Caudoviricetes sp.]